MQTCLIPNFFSPVSDKIAFSESMVNDKCHSIVPKGRNLDFVGWIKQPDAMTACIILGFL